ncbi:MAG: hypothetical protein JWM56_773 [Candidatus Peribacteria bacterium]|nr:hypothetical protein [Candidatus Peribacteria bacterium]
MKILVTSDSYLPRLGGGEYHVLYMNEALRALGHTVVLLTNEPGDSDLQTIRVPYKGLGSVWSILAALWKYSEDADVVHAHYSYRLAFLAAVVTWLRRKPLVLTQHGLGLLPQVGATFLQDVVFRVWRRWSMRVARIIISTSDDLSVDIRSLGFGEKIIHIPNGYDASRFQPLPFPLAPGDNPILLTVRRLVPKNGIQYLIAALPAIRHAFPGVRYVCIGDGRLKSELEVLVDELGVRDCITFHGTKDHDELLEFYRMAHVVVIPSTAESTSLSCIEAMAMQKTIVASRVGGLVELIGSHEERGYLAAITPTEHCDYHAPLRIGADRIQLLADAIIHALKHPAEAQRKATDAAAYMPSMFAWPVLAERVVAEAYMPAVQRS